MFEGAPRQTLSRAVGIAVIAFVASANSIANGFVFDDAYNVLHNPWIIAFPALGDAFTHHMAGFAAGLDTSYYRPVMHVLLWASRAVFGPEAWGFHAANVLLHAGTSAAVYVLLVRWARQDAAQQTCAPDAISASRLYISGPAIGALIFAVHPVHAEAVAWISGIVDLSFGFFFLAALLVATSRRSSSWTGPAIAGVLFLASLLAKEPAVMLLPTVVVAFGIRGDLWCPTQRVRAWRILASLSAATFLYLLLRVNALGGLMGTGGAHRVKVGVVDGVLTALTLLADYSALLVWPQRLSAVHARGVVTTLTPGVVGGVLTLAALAAIAWFGRRSAGVVVGVALLVLPLLPALYVPVLGEGLVAERYLYLPLAGAALLVAIALEHPLARRAPVALRSATAVLVIGLLAAGTLSRNEVWRSDLSLWSDAAREEPLSAAAQEYLGHALLASGDASGAIPALTRALALDPAHHEARLDLASALASTGNAAEATRAAELAVTERPANASAHTVLGYALSVSGRFSEAAAAYERALELDPSAAAAHNGLAICVANLGRMDRAVLHFGEAVRLDPGNPQYARNLALAMGQ